jgi:hypothetical protein
MEAREPKEVEDARTAIFVRGTHTGATVDGVMKDLVRNHAVSNDAGSYLSDVSQTSRRHLV